MGKTLQERIKELDEYRPNISYKDGAFVLKIYFKQGWNILEPSNDKVAYKKDDVKKGLHWYVSMIDDSDMIFDLIEETIAVNKEMEKKLLLYKEKVKDLQELFLSDIQYEKLVTLQFTFPGEKMKRGRKGKKQEDLVQDEVSAEEAVVGIESIEPAKEVSTGELSELDKKVMEALV